MFETLKTATAAAKYATNLTLDVVAITSFVYGTYQLGKFAIELIPQNEINDNPEIPNN